MTSLKILQSVSVVLFSLNYDFKVCIYIITLKFTIVLFRAID